MSDAPLIDRLSQISPKALRELEFWLEPWFRTKHMDLAPPAAPPPPTGTPSFPIAARNDTDVTINAGDPAAPLVFSGAGTFRANDGGAFYAAGTDAITILQAGVYECSGYLTANIAPIDVQIWIHTTPSLGSDNNYLLGADQGRSAPLMQYGAGVCRNILVIDGGTVPVDVQLYAFSAADGLTFVNANHNLTIVRQGDIGTLPPSGFD